MEYRIGFDIGGTKCAVVLGAAEEGKIRVLRRSAFPTKECKSPRETADRLFSLAEAITEQAAPGAAIANAGVSCGGPLDSARGVILSPPNLPGWDEVPFTAWAERRLGVPVRLQNDANACALAEWQFGAGRGCESMVFLTFGTGLGAGLILGGRLYEGACGMAGEVGHLRMSGHGPVGYGKEGSWEGFCSGGGIAQIARTKVLEQLQAGKAVSFCASPAQAGQLSAKAVAEAAADGDPLALEIYRVSGDYLGRGLAILIDILNPEVVVIGSIFARSRSLLWPQAEKAMRAEALPASVRRCRIVPAGLGEQLGDFAALAVAGYDPAKPRPAPADEAPQT